MNTRRKETGNPSDMLRLSVDMKILETNIGNVGADLDLNEEWTLACVWKSSTAGSFVFRAKLESIEIRRKTCSEETSVSGRLSFQENGLTIFTQAFSILIGSGFSCMKLMDVQKDIYDSLGSRTVSVYGVVNIIPVIEKCTSDIETRGCKIYVEPTSLVQLSDDFERLLDPQTPCDADVNLKCGSASIPAHKLVLCARSPVFSTMFQNPMKETHTNEVVVTDIDASVLRALITYIYTGKTSVLTVSSASDLVFAADKYQLPDLKRVCCDFLKESISLQNVMRILDLGDLHSEDLKSFSMGFICKNYRNFAEFEKMEEWETLRKEKPTLALYILASLLKSKD